MPSELRRGRPVRFWRCAALGVFAMLLLAPAASRAQSSRSLRARLEALRSEAPAPLPEGALLSIEHTIDVAERIEGRFPERTPEWRRLASTYLDRAEEGVDPFSEARGKIVERGYRSTLSPVLQGYAVYIPPDYDPSRRYPLYIALHGGSSNGNLFLGVLLGNNMDWLTYDQHLWDEYTARWTPDWIVVAPTGFGQVMWRWMGEQDVLDVLADVERHYPIDADRVVLGGLSNGGVGAYAIGMRHAWRFAAVQAMAGAPSWSQYVGGGLAPEERLEVRRYSGLDLAENTAMTDFRYYHGRTDTGPMRPPYVEEFSRRLARLGLPRNETWLEAGHDILYRVHRHGRVYSELAGVRRDRRPQEVRLVSGDYRAARQHWLEISRLERFPELGRAHARVEGATLRIETEGVQALQLHLRDCPLEGESIRLEFDGALAYEGPLGALGDVLHLRRGAEGWETGFPQDPEGLFKGPGRSGPISDAYYGRMVHVYGTQNEDHTDALRRAAERGARGWPLWAWDLRQEVVADTSVDQALAASAHLVLYGSPGDNAVLERLSASLPIQIEEGAVRVGERRHEGRDVGVRFVYPNPMATDRYVIVQAGTTPEVVALGNKLAEFLPDYIVYDARTVAGAQRRVSGRTRPRAMGWFDSRWRLPTETDATA
ncbi:MAG: alpha/beta hydrolase-fold protein, partial [Myxococcales bacterium]|nr:alpha/beta hydrolase-fold protein [Myxococcales bacterium]